jgi:hypothetical protein
MTLSKHRRLKRTQILMMTDEERRGRIASILARGLLRLLASTSQSAISDAKTSVGGTRADGAMGTKGL